MILPWVPWNLTGGGPLEAADTKGQRPGNPIAQATGLGSCAREKTKG